MQDADDEVEDVVGQIAAKNVREHKIIEQDEREGVAQRPQKAQRSTLVAHLEVFGDQIAHQIAVLPVTGKAGGGPTGRGDGVGLHGRRLCVLRRGGSMPITCPSAAIDMNDRCPTFQPNHLF